MFGLTGGAASSFSGPQPYTLSKQEIVSYSTMTATSAVLLLFALLQLVRIGVRSHQLSGRTRRRHFLAKRLFHLLLFASMAVRVADYFFVLTGPCWTRKGVFEDWWCWPVDASMRRSSSLLLFLSYAVTLLFWREFMHGLNNDTGRDWWSDHRGSLLTAISTLGALLAAYVVAIFMLRDHDMAQVYVDLASMFFIGACYLIAGIGVVWQGCKVSTLFVKRQRDTVAGDAARGKVVHKFLVLIVLCSVLLIFRALWAMVFGAYGIVRRIQWPGWVSLVIIHLGCEVTPCLCMAVIMFPLPPAPRKSTSSSRSPSNVQYTKLPN